MVEIVERKPTIVEFESVVNSVGFRSHDHIAVQIALSNTIFCVCAVDGGRVIGFGRVVGDGAITFVLTSVIVCPLHQRRGIGSRIVEALCSSVAALPYKNIVLEAIPLPGTTTFYERFGFRALRGAPAGMVRWFNDECGHDG